MWLIRTQDGDFARWSIGLGLLAVLACVAAAAGLVPSTTTAIALLLTASATFAGPVSIGLPLVPADVALAVALLKRPPGRARRSKLIQLVT